MLGAWRNWVQRNGRKNARTSRCRLLSLEALEDRTLPSFVAAPGFAVGANSGVGSKPIAVVTGDFNRDGKMDVATVNQGSNNVSVLLGNGNGTFRPALNSPVGHSPAALLAVDLNGNNILDLVTANKSDNNITVLLGRGDGTFVSAGTFAAGASPVSLAYGDFNGDHHTDLAVADNGGSTVTLLLGTGTGKFTQGGTVTVGNNPTSVAVMDFNNDGLSDIASVSGGFGHLDINLNNGDGTFAAAVNYTTGFCANTVVVGDFNHDGQPDLAVACNFPSGDGVSILLGNSDGTFQTFAKYSVGGQTPLTLTVADLNSDGFQDIVTANDQFANNSVSVLMGNGDGTFGTVHVYQPGQTPVGVAVGDFNGDGIPDVVTANSGPFMGTPVGSISLLLGNGDGTLLAAPDLIVPGPGPCVEADFNGDNVPDLAVITTSPSYSGVDIFLGLGNGQFGDPIQTTAINQPSAIAVGDFNGDQITDLAVASTDGVSILLGNNDGTFGLPQTFAAGSSPAWVAVDDFNGDNNLDLAVANNASGSSVSILLGNGDGSFQTATSVSAGGAATYIATADLNGDHHEDLAVVNGPNNQVSVLFGNGDGSFGTAKSYSTQVGPGSVGIGDFNGDHRPDLAVPTFFGSGASSEVAVFKNGITHTFGLSETYKTGSRPQGIAVTDLNGDGKLDLAVVNNFDDNLFVFSGTGLGTFGAASSYVVGDRPTWISAADFNGDGRPDLAVVNSNSGTVTLLETPQAVTHFHVRVLPASATAGVAFHIQVTALDPANRLVTGYVGTMSFTSSDGTATLPAAYAFTAADHGVHTFTVTLRQAGSQNIVAHWGGASGTGSITVLPTTANHLRVTSVPVTAGSPFDVSVTALDPFNNVATSYLGLVHFSTNDPAKGVTLPADYTFIAGDSGIHVFTGGATLLTAGPHTVTATDPPVLTGPKGSMTVSVQPTTASQLFITGPTSATAGTAFNVTITAKDPYNNIATGFTGTVHFASSDGNAALPADYTFTAADKGVHVFQPILKTSGPQSLTASSAGCTDGQENGILVKPAKAAQVSFVQQPANTFAASPIKPAVTVQVQDAYGNLVAAGVPVTLTLANNPGAASLAGASAVTNSVGVATFSAVTLSKASQGYTLVAHSGTGTSVPSSAFTIYTTTHFGVTFSIGSHVQAGTSFTVTVTARDALNHPDLTYVGTIHFTSTASPLADLPADYTFQPGDNGQQTFTVTLKRAGLQSVTVADTLTPTFKGSASATVSAAALSQFLVTGYPLSVAVNTSHTFTVIAQDAYGNTVTGYLGTVVFSNTGGTAVLPGPYTFKATDLGRHVFSAIFKTAGPGQSLTVTDQSNSSDTGSENGINVS
jgi:hypothetical protein